MNLEKILTMPYVDFMAFIKETNRAPWGEMMLLELAKNSFLSSDSSFLHIACNTGSSTRLISDLTKAKGIWIDINKNMVTVANDFSIRENKKVTHQVMDAQNLSFQEQEFDLVFSAWGIAFVPDKKKAIQEMVRVTRNGGFVADIVMYYRQTPPDYLIKEMNTLMNINIQKRDKNFWINLYENQWLKLVYEYEGAYTQVTQEKLLWYSRKMSNLMENMSVSEKLLIEYKLYWIMSLFTENHKYLGATLLIFRKKDSLDQISLFT